MSTIMRMYFCVWLRKLRWSDHKYWWTIVNQVLPDFKSWNIGQRVCLSWFSNNLRFLLVCGSCLQPPISCHLGRSISHHFGALPVIYGSVGWFLLSMSMFLQYITMINRRCFIGSGDCVRRWFFGSDQALILLLWSPERFRISIFL